MIAQFEKYLGSIKGYSPKTIEGYMKDIHHFARWMKKKNSNARWSTVTREDIDEYIIAEVARGMKPATTNRKLASISALYNYFKREGLDVENPCKYESRRKISENVPNTIPIGDLKTAYDHATGATKFMLGLIMTTGMRIQEVLDMRWEHIDFMNQCIKIQGKGGKSRLVYTTAEVLKPASDAQQYGYKRGKMWSIDQRTARFMIWEALKPYSNAAQLSPHAIRHTYATNLAANGCNCSTLSKILGHKHLETTQKYIDMGQQPIKEICQKYALTN